MSVPQMHAAGSYMNKRLAIATLTIGLVATGVAPAQAAVKAGAKCASAKAKIIEQGLTYTCLKNGKKLTTQNLLRIGLGRRVHKLLLQVLQRRQI